MEIIHDTYGNRGAVVDACIGRTQVETLLDTGSATDLIRSDVARDLLDSSEIEPYRGGLETGVGQKTKVDECMTTSLELAAIDENLDKLVIPKMKAEIVIGLRALKENRCLLTFSHDEDFLLTGTKEGSMVPICYLPPNASPKRMLSATQDPGGKGDGDSDSSKERRRQLIAAAVEQSDEVVADEEGWPASVDDHSAGVICEDKEDDETGGCPKVIPLEEALRRCRPMSVHGIVASVNETA